MRLQDRKHPFLSVSSALAVCAALVLALSGCEEEKVAAPPPSPPEVVLTEVAKETVPIVLDASGTIKPIKRIEVVPRVTGFIFERYFTEGSFVEEGQPLYLIDPRPFEDQLAQLEAELEGQQAELAFWQSEDVRYRKLEKQGAASKERTEGVRAKLQTSMAEIEATKVKIRNAKLDISYTRINAPFYGLIQQTRLNQGDLATKEQDILTTLVMMDPIYVIFHLSRSQVFDVQKLKRRGGAFDLKDMVIEVVLSDGKLFDNKGRVDFIGTEIDPSTDSVTIRGILENPTKNEVQDFDLIPGQYAPVRFTVGETPDALVIPQTAVVETQAGAHVYIVAQDNKAERRSVELGRTHGGKVIVTEGLEEGERVVSLGVQKVKSGSEVKPTSSVEADTAAKQE
jgi:RND family efflux transporter MFP subunit